MIVVLDKHDVEHRVWLRVGEKTVVAPKLDDLQIIIVTDANIGDRRQDVYDRINKRLLQVLELPPSTSLPLYFDMSKSRLMRELQGGNLFSVNVMKFGVLLYISGKFAIPEYCSVNYARVAAVSRGDYDKFMLLADEFIWGAEQYSSHKNYALATYLLYQAAESLMVTIENIHLQYYMRHRQLMHLVYYCSREVPGVADIFPCNEEEEIRLFQLLADANIDARAHPERTLSANDFEKLMSKIIALRELAHQVCPERIAYYIRRSKD